VAHGGGSARALRWDIVNRSKEAPMPTGSSPKREKEYKELKSEFKKEHRYPGREEEVAARIVNKQRAEHGETKQHAKK
jgi:hypothetical protein